MATVMQSGLRSPSELDSMTGIPRVNSETKLKEKKSFGKKVKDWFKKPFTKASTATEIPLDQRTDISSSQNLALPHATAEWNPYQHPAHGQIFVPGSIAVVRQGAETIAYIPGNIAVAVNRPGINLDSVPVLLAANPLQTQETVEEQDPICEETPKLVGEMSPKFETLEPAYNPVDVAAQIDDVEHMNEKDAELYRNMRESRMLYAGSGVPKSQFGAIMSDPNAYRTSLKKSTVKVNEHGRDSMRESRQLA